jgi:hypothetical protein
MMNLMFNQTTGILERDFCKAHFDARENIGWELHSVAPMLFKETNFFGDPALEFHFPNISYPPWDINKDGRVNYLDASLLISHYGQTGTPGWIPEDIVADGDIQYLDMSSLVHHYGESY